MTSCPFSLRTTYFFFVYSSLTVVVVCVCFNILGWYKKNPAHNVNIVFYKHISFNFLIKYLFL